MTEMNPCSSSNTDRPYLTVIKVSRKAERCLALGNFHLRLLGWRSGHLIDRLAGFQVHKSVWSFLTIGRI